MLSYSRSVIALLAVSVCSAGPAYAFDAGERGGTLATIINAWLNFNFALPSAMALMAFVIFAMVSAMLFRFVYTTNIRSQIKQGIHPNILSNTMVLWTLCAWMVAAFYLMPTIGLGYYAILFPIMVALSLVFMIAQRVLVIWTLFMILVVLAVVLLRIFGTV